MLFFQPCLALYEKNIFIFELLSFLLTFPLYTHQSKRNQRSVMLNQMKTMLNLVHVTITTNLKIIT